MPRARKQPPVYWLNLLTFAVIREESRTFEAPANCIAGVVVFQGAGFNAKGYWSGVWNSSSCAKLPAGTSIKEATILGVEHTEVCLDGKVMIMRTLRTPGHSNGVFIIQSGTKTLGSSPMVET